MLGVRSSYPDRSIPDLLLLDLQANCAVCGADDSGATALCYSASSKDLYGTQCFGFYGKIRSWKSVSCYLL